jgi:hypothetical protein
MNIIHMDLRLNEAGIGRTGKKDGSEAVKVGPGSEKLLEGSEKACEAEMAQVALEVEAEAEFRLGVRAEGQRENRSSALPPR